MLFHEFFYGYNACRIPRISQHPKRNILVFYFCVHFQLLFSNQHNTSYQVQLTSTEPRVSTLFTFTTLVYVWTLFLDHQD
jgi:hypothetical protein